MAIKNQSQFIKDLNKIYKDLLNIKITKKDSFETSMKKFYAVMRKWGICQGTYDKNGNGILVNNPEWNMCFNVFWTNHISTFNIWLALSTPPKDLRAYNKKIPKVEMSTFIPGKTKPSNYA